MHRQQTQISKYQNPIQNTRQYTNQNTIIRHQYNTTTNNYPIMPVMPIIAINVGNVGQHASPVPNNEPRNQTHRQRQTVNQTTHQHTHTTTKLIYICMSCGLKHLNQNTCCNNTPVKLSSIFTGSALEGNDFQLTDLFNKQRSGLFNQVPLNTECLSDAVNNQQRIKLYSLKNYTITGQENQRNNRFSQCNNITTPLTDCVYILIPFNLPRLYVPSYGVIQLDARNSFTLPAGELVTINNDIKTIVI